MQNLVHKQNEETRNLMSMLAQKLELHRPKRKQFAVTLGIISVAAFASLSIFATGPNAEPEANVEKAWPVSTMAVKKDNLAPSFSAFGRLEATQTANIRSDVVSRIVAVHVKEGDWVEAGEHLVQLDDRETKLRVLERQAELKQHQANLASAQSQFELVKANAAHFQSRYEVAQAKLTRHQNLMKKRLISKSLLDEVMSQANTASIEYQNHQREITNLPLQIAAHDANVARADALLQQAQLDLEKTKIVAPFSGPILSVMVAPGDHSNLSVPLVSLANIDSFEVRVQVPNNYARQFQNSLNLTSNAPITARDEFGNQLQLARVANHVRAGQTGVDAFFTVPTTQELSMAVGRVFNMHIKLAVEQQVFAVPVQSLYDNQRIYTVKDGRLVGHEVERVGEVQNPTLGYQILVRAPEIKSGDTVITTQLPKAITGLLVSTATES